MSSAVELIRQRNQDLKIKAVNAAYEASHKARVAAHDAHVEHEQKKQREAFGRTRLRESKKITNQIFRESGVLREIKSIRRKITNRKFHNALFINYDAYGAEIILAWGNIFSVKKDKNGHKFIDFGREETGRGEFITDRSKDYSLISVYADRRTKSLRIGRRQLDRQGSQNRPWVNSLIAYFYLHPYRVTYTSKEKVGLEGVLPAAKGGPSDLSRGGA